MKRTLAAITAIGLATGAFAEMVNLNDIQGTVNTERTLSDGTLLTGQLNGELHPCKISIADGATVTISNVLIQGVHTSTVGSHVRTNNWAGLTCVGDATIILKGNENFISGFSRDYPGIYVPSGKTLTIRGDDDVELQAWSGKDADDIYRGAGIGGVYRGTGTWKDCGNIVIEGGHIIAQGGEGAAGIGGTPRSTCGDITIKGGKVSAHGGKNAAGIGSGYYNSSCGNITITGGTIQEASTEGPGDDSVEKDYYAAGIGSGYLSSCGDITIGAGIEEVRAMAGDYYNTPIGAGKGGTCGTVSVDASLFDRYLSHLRMRTIRHWYSYDLGDLPLTEYGEAIIPDGSIVTGTIATNAHLRIDPNATVILRDVRINEDLVQDPEYDPDEWVQFGAGLACIDSATIILEGTNVVNAFHYEFPGIFIGSGYTLTIKGDGKLVASGFAEGWGAGIGGGADANVSNCGNIVIESGDIVANGGIDAAGIGGAGGNFTGCGVVVIGPNVTSITATGGWTPIGPGRVGDCAGVVVDGTLGDNTSGPTRTITKGAGGGGTVLPAPTFAADGDAATTKFVQGENGKWTLTAFAEMSNDALGKDVADGQIKVYAAPTVEGLDGASPMTSGMTVKEKKSAVKTVIEVTPPGNPPSQFFRVKFGN
ncbi:MAG: hypothetical protein IJI54_06285 [Kiritimatiellae bacterium]|nr:hypothetical protein [Kiritimatiellia bacterium]